MDNLCATANFKGRYLKAQAVFDNLTEAQKKKLFSTGWLKIDSQEKKDKTVNLYLYQGEDGIGFRFKNARGGIDG